MRLSGGRKRKDLRPGVLVRLCGDRELRVVEAVYGSREGRCVVKLRGLRMLVPLFLIVSD